MVAPAWTLTLDHNPWKPEQYLTKFFPNFSVEQKQEIVHISEHVRDQTIDIAWDTFVYSFRENVTRCRCNFQHNTCTGAQTSFPLQKRGVQIKGQNLKKTTDRYAGTITKMKLVVVFGIESLTRKLRTSILKTLHDAGLELTSHLTSSSELRTTDWSLMHSPCKCFCK